MNDDVRDAIEQADLLIKEGKLKSAWTILLPYQSDPMARKRLMWLKKKGQRQVKVKKVRSLQSGVSRRTRLYLFTGVMIVFGLGILAIYGLSIRESVLPTPIGDTTSIVTDSTINVSASPFTTDVPPTEAAQEVGIQQQLRDWFVSVEGVNQILTLDVDVPTDEPPLVYAEIGVNSGFNDTHIPDMFVKKLNDTLNTTEYSDFVIIINDGIRVVEYRFDSGNILWQQTELATPVPL